MTNLVRFWFMSREKALHVLFQNELLFRNEMIGKISLYFHSNFF